MADSKKLKFSKPPILKKISQKIQGLVLGLVRLIDPRGIDVAQPIWLRGCKVVSSKTGKKFLCVLGCF